jgi:hypothetical protein
MLLDGDIGSSEMARILIDVFTLADYAGRA